MEELTKSVWDDDNPLDDKSEEHTLKPQLENEFSAQPSTFNPDVSPLVNTFNSYSIDDPFANPFDEASKEEDEHEVDNIDKEQTSVEAPYESFSPQRAQEQDLHTSQRHQLQSQILSELTQGSNEDDDDLEQSLLKSDSRTIKNSDELFHDKDSPLKIIGSDAHTTTLSSQSRPISVKKFKAARPRKFSAKTNAQHLLGESSTSPKDMLGPLALESEKLNAKSDQQQGEENEREGKELKSREPIGKDGLEEAKSENRAAVSQQKEEQQQKIVAETKRKDSNNLEISVSDPMKVGDITTAHVVYTIRTKNKNLDSPHFPRVETAEVQRRYSDFRWLYHQLQANHPGKIIPPPPAKQSYIGRFNQKVIEHRRVSLEKMLNNIANKPALSNDLDFVTFLTNDREGSFDDSGLDESAINESSYGGTASATSAAANAAANVAIASTGFMSSLFSSNKVVEPDAYFTEKKHYIDDLENNLKQFSKTIELIGSQRQDMINILEELAITLEELSTIEISRATSDLLIAFSEVEFKIRDNLERLGISDQLTIGFTIEEYLRIIEAINYIFQTRIKMYQSLTSLKSQIEKLSRKQPISPDRAFELDRLKERETTLQKQFDDISQTIKNEFDEFEMSRIDDFRNNVEIYIESSIESQKEAIEIYETFYSRYIAVGTE
ncbi:uncharacterized protein LODBEIA_P39490 [Lodderomyces beijingensis]|uniref:PX domain-containing protein n=1 Tax=Lodderomyces beijingensis TaxID=1775926 RepID=A0ABP0ZRB3_9ASCO